MHRPVLGRYTIDWVYANSGVPGRVERMRMDYPTADDHMLVAAAHDGDLEAFEAIVRRHTRAVYAHAMRFFGDAQAADEVTQEVFIKVYRALDSFDGRAKFTTWLYRVTRNACLDEVRAGRRRPQPVDPLTVTAIAAGDLSDQVALSTSVQHALRSLPPEDRDALSAVAIFGLTYAEAGEVLGVPAGTVKSRTFRARRTLMTALGMKAGI